MTFTPIDKATWPRREYFDHYVTRNPCTYSMTVRLDVTNIKKRGLRLYPALLYALATVVNRHQEFRCSIREGVLGFYDRLEPSYAVFHKEDETFSLLWTPYDPDYSAFLAAYEADLARYGDNRGLWGKPGAPENCFDVSMLPWAGFEGFNLNLQQCYDYLRPIFTLGRFEEREGRYTLPLAVQVHHGVCDGYHTCRLVREVQEVIDALAEG